MDVQVSCASECSTVRIVNKPFKLLLLCISITTQPFHMSCQRKKISSRKKFFNLFLGGWYLWHSVVPYSFSDELFRGFPQEINSSSCLQYGLYSLVPHAHSALVTPPHTLLLQNFVTNKRFLCRLAFSFSLQKVGLLAILTRSASPFLFLTSHDSFGEIPNSSWV